MNKACNQAELPQNLTGAEKERVIRANHIYCQACEEKGVRVCSWNSFSSWQEYVDGKISDSQLAEKARDEINQFTETFSKYTVISPEDTTPVRDEARKRERAKLATKIYKQVCQDSGRSPCFFKNFATWSDYVNGRIEEPEFVEKARQEVAKMAEEATA